MFKKVSFYYPTACFTSGVLLIKGHGEVRIFLMKALREKKPIMYTTFSVEFSCKL